jgi:NAD-dependent dihydropyrimidine dehydrogenase PreA subunit
MAYVITETCIDCKDGACVDCCPVDCIYTGVRTLYIQPDECISCGICVSVCPPAAIFEDREVPASQAHFIAINREFFEPQVSGIGSAGGASELKVGRRVDHPWVTAYPTPAGSTN